MSVAMDGTCSMYPVKKNYQLPETISLPTTMYSMKNLQVSSPLIKDMNSSHEKNEVKQLEERQEKILARLEELEIQLQQIRNNSKNMNVTNISPKIKLMSEIGVMRQIVIHANPKYPPLGLSMFYDWLKKHMNIGTESFVHSSVQFSIDDSLRNLFSSDLSVCKSQADLFITLIWQNTSEIDPVMIINPLSQVAIKGEVNILRYLSYFIRSNESDALHLTDVDNILDLVHASIVHGNNKERQSALRVLNSRLGKNTWVNGSAFSVADIAAWGALKQNALLTELPANVKKWTQAVEKLN